MSNTKKGKQGEDIAVKYLKENGYKILERNFHYSKYGEIDIIAQKKFTIVAVEVKARSTLLFGKPQEAVTREKLNKIIMTFNYYLQNVNAFHLKRQIDVISVVFDKQNPDLYKIEHLKNIEL